MLCAPVFAEFQAYACSSSPVENVDVRFTMVGRRLYVAAFVHRPYLGKGRRGSWGGGGRRREVRGEWGGGRGEEGEGKV
jgi:hypothetical protein